MLVRQLEDEVVKAKTQASHTNPEVSFRSSIVIILAQAWKEDYD